MAEDKDGCRRLGNWRNVDLSTCNHWLYRGLADKEISEDLIPVVTLWCQHRETIVSAL